MSVFGSVKIATYTDHRLPRLYPRRACILRYLEEERFVTTHCIGAHNLSDHRPLNIYIAAAVPPSPSRPRGR